MSRKIYLVCKRIFDFIVSLILLILFAPLFLTLAILIKADSKGPVFYLQKRVGKNFREFQIIKFRTMKPSSDEKGLLTVGGNDPRITSIGKFLRTYKLDELPQLINVLLGSMSLVGPRPEVKKYVDLYNEEQRKVLSVKPGITDPTSIKFFNENEILARYNNPEEGYIREVMPEKLRLNLDYISNQSFGEDIFIIVKTIQKIFLHKRNKN